MKKKPFDPWCSGTVGVTIGGMGQGVAQAAFSQKSAQPVEELEFDVNCFGMHFYYGANMMTNLHWAEVPA